MKLNAKILGRCLEGLFLVLIPILLIFSLTNLFFPDVFMGEKVMAAVDNLYGFNIKQLSIAIFSLLVVINSIGLAFMVYGLWLGAQAARLYAKGEFLTEASGRLFDRLKKVSLFWGVFNIMQTLGTCKIFMPKLETNMFLYSLISIGIINLLLYIFFAAIAAVVKKGAGLQKDQDLTV